MVFHALMFADVFIIYQGTRCMLTHRKTMFGHYYCLNSMTYSPKFYEKYDYILLPLQTVRLDVFINFHFPGPSHI